MFWKWGNIINLNWTLYSNWAIFQKQNFWKRIEFLHKYSSSTKVMTVFYYRILIWSDRVQQLNALYYWLGAQSLPNQTTNWRVDSTTGSPGKPLPTGQRVACSQGQEEEHRLPPPIHLQAILRITHLHDHHQIEHLPPDNHLTHPPITSRTHLIAQNPSP